MITLEQLTAVLDDRFGSLNRKLDERFNAIDQRFDTIDQRFEKLETDLQDLARMTAEGFTDVYTKVDEVHNRIDALEERTGLVETTK